MHGQQRLLSDSGDAAVPAVARAVNDSSYLLRILDPRRDQRLASLRRNSMSAHEAAALQSTLSQLRCTANKVFVRTACIMSPEKRLQSVRCAARVLIPLTAWSV